jgi:hypothetical protein
LFAADAGNRVILRYNKSGKLVRRMASATRTEHPGFIIPSPFFDVEIARWDAVGQQSGPTPRRAYTPDGDFRGAWGTVSMGIAGFCGCCNPINLALLPDGRFVTCEKGLPRVKIYSAEGQFESVVAGVEAFAENAKVCNPSDCSHRWPDAVVD